MNGNDIPWRILMPSCSAVSGKTLFIGVQLMSFQPLRRPRLRWQLRQFPRPSASAKGQTIQPVKLATQKKKKKNNTSTSLVGKAIGVSVYVQISKNGVCVWSCGCGWVSACVCVWMRIVSLTVWCEASVQFWTHGCGSKPCTPRCPWCNQGFPYYCWVLSKKKLMADIDPQHPTTTSWISWIGWFSSAVNPAWRRDTCATASLTGNCSLHTFPQSLARPVLAWSTGWSTNHPNLPAENNS